jgi:hypothetical protein
LTFNNAAVMAGVATPASAYHVHWFRFDNALGTPGHERSPSTVSEPRAVVPDNLHASPSVTAAPAVVRIRVSVAPDAANRAVAVIADSDDLFGSSEVPLPGERAPRTIFVEFRSLPAGTYEIRGVRVGSGGHALAEARAHVVVTGMDGE